MRGFVVLQETLIESNLFKNSLWLSHHKESQIRQFTQQFLSNTNSKRIITIMPKKGSVYIVLKKIVDLPYRYTGM